MPLAPRRLLLIVAAVCLLRAATPAWADPPSPGPLRLRVLSYNIHHGEGTDGRLDLERIARVVQSVEPDLVALQEVDRGTARTGQVDQPAELARLTGLNVAFGGNIRHQGGDYGNAVLTRHEIRRQQNHLLPSPHGGERRGVLEVEVELPEQRPPLVLLATHFDFRPDNAERLASVATIEKLLAAGGPRPALLAGDLNATPTSAAITALAEHWTATTSRELPTSPADNPRRQIDYVWLRPVERWRVVETRVLDEAVASDHRAILAVVELLPAP